MSYFTWRFATHQLRTTNIITVKEIAQVTKPVVNTGSSETVNKHISFEVKEKSSTDSSIKVNEIRSVRNESFYEQIHPILLSMKIVGALPIGKTAIGM